MTAPFGRRGFSWKPAVFIAMLVAIPIATTGDVVGDSRFTIAAFPVAALLDEWLVQQSHRWG